MLEAAEDDGKQGPGWQIRPDLAAFDRLLQGPQNEGPGAPHQIEHPRGGRRRQGERELLGKDEAGHTGPFSDRVDPRLEQALEAFHWGQRGVRIGAGHHFPNPLGSGLEDPVPGLRNVGTARPN